MKRAFAVIITRIVPHAIATRMRWQWKLCSLQTLGRKEVMCTEIGWNETRLAALERAMDAIRLRQAQTDEEMVEEREPPDFNK